ncbi:MAG TPA: hypothetical protein VF584_11740 [Longimicrobium sp.]|jgi:hypothetical protein
MLALDPQAQISSSTEVNTGVVEIPSMMPGGFDAPLWQLLQDIKAAGIPLRGKIAEYAGFYTKVGATITTEWDPSSDNGVNPDLEQTGTSQPNKSLDKLTFLIMFRLPFQGEAVQISPPLTDPELDLYCNRRIVKTPDGTYVLGAFHEVVNSKGEVLSPQFQLCTITRPNPVANFDIAGQDLFYDTPSDSYYAGSPFISNFGDPLDVGGTTWSKRANDIRAAYAVKRLNGAGEQVALAGSTYDHVDDGGNVVSFDYNTPDTARAYSYYEIDFGDLFPGRVPKEAIDDQATIDAIKTLPLYYFLTVYTENKPQNFVRGAHYPDEIETVVHAKRRITFGTYDTAGVFTASSPQPGSAAIAGRTINRDSTDRYYVTSASTPTNHYLEEDFAGDEDFTADTFYTSGGVLTGLLVRYQAGQFYAENPNIRSQATTRWASGLTLGYGYDIGGNYATANVYKVEFTIQKLAGATGSFTLHYESRSVAIPFAAGDASLRLSLRDLMGIDESLIAISSATGPAAGYTGWRVTIQQRIGDPVNGFRNIYSHEVFYHKPASETPAKILITPATDSQRYLVRPASELPDNPVNYSSFETLLNGFYASGDFTAPDSVLDGTHKLGFNAGLFKAALKKIFGLYRGPGMLIYLRNKATFDAFQMPVAKRTIVQNYLLIFSKKYYTQTLIKNKVTNIIATGAAPNILEKLLFATVSYGGIGRWVVTEYEMDNVLLKPKMKNGAYVRISRNDPGIIRAISSHNQYELKNAFKSRNRKLAARSAFLVGYVEKFHSILYQGVEA